jgi:lipoprotein-releasing system ATP-binding protein
MLAIVGESGSGKSTLLHLLSGLDRPSAGDIFFAGRLLNEMSGDELAEFRNRQVGFVWQFHYLLPEFTALENVMMPMIIAGRNEAEASTEARRRLEAVGLGERLNHRSGELSGGEQQRAALARALMMSPTLLMADEPTGNLDERTAIMVFELLQQLHRGHNLTSVIVTHNRNFARRCDRVVELHGGHLTEFAKLQMERLASDPQSGG